MRFSTIVIFIFYLFIHLFIHGIIINIVAVIATLAIVITYVNACFRVNSHADLLYQFFLLFAVLNKLHSQSKVY